MTRERLPAVCQERTFVVDGCLMAYGPSFPDMFRRAAYYVDRILKGAKPADLPVEQATKFELVVNLKTAKTLGLTIQPSVLARADEVLLFTMLTACAWRDSPAGPAPVVAGLRRRHGPEGCDL